MRGELAFHVPFSGFCGTTFINCFASVYVHLEHIALGGSDYPCRQLDGKPCNSCGNCAKGGSTPIARQERYFFLFDTMCGRSSLRCRFDGQRTAMERMICERDFYDGSAEGNIDFLFGFAGYAYRHCEDKAAFAGEVRASIDAGRPVIAKVKDGQAPFRVVTGYDADAMLCPDFTNAQRRPQNAPSFAELDALYLVGERIAPRYTLKDGLARIRQVMAYNAAEKLWDGYTLKMGLYTADSLSRADVTEKKARMKRVAETMWHTFNCHNFAEVFRGRYLEELRNPAFDPMCQAIGGPCYGYTHDLAWALIGLEACADWSQHAAGYFGEMIELTLAQIARNDARVLEMVDAMLAILNSPS